MPTQAKAVVDRNLVRAGYFMEIHRTLHNAPGAPTLPIRELPRAAVVFAVGALDAYLGHVSAEVLVARGRHAVLTTDDQGILEKLASDVKSLALEVAFVEDHQSRLDALQRAITNYFEERISNHGWKAVTATVQRVGGDVSAFRARLVNVGYAEPQTLLEEYTTLRHDVVHRGMSPPCRRPYAEGCLAFIQAVADKIDEAAVNTLDAIAAPEG